jgi:GNAT superfamily N-acetyltransferase
MVGDLTALGLRPWRCRAWVVEDESRRLVAAVVVVKSCFDRWYGSVLVLDVASGPLVASIVDRSPAWSVSASTEDIVPVLDHLGRRSRTTAVPCLVSAFPHAIAPEPDGRTRLSRKQDKSHLVDLLAQYELNPAPTRWQARSWARRLIDRSVVIVAEDHDTIVGAVVVLSDSNRYLIVDRITVRPSHRGQGLSWALAARAQAMANAMRRSVIATIAPTNPMTFDPTDLAADRWIAVALRPPYRFRGQNRLRAIYTRFGRLDRASIEIFRDADGPTKPTRGGD